MNPETFLLVALSAVTHAYWNFLLKRAGGSQTVVALSKVVEALLFVPILLIPALRATSWMFPVVGAGLVLLNYVLLAAAYRRGDLSIVYPVVRGSMLVFLPPLAFVFMEERLSWQGWLAIATILVGIVVLQWPGGRSSGGLSAMASALALGAGLMAACYTIWDKRAVQVMTPLTYFGAYTLILGAGYAGAMARSPRADSTRLVLHKHWWPIVQIGVLNSGSYLLTLAALKTGDASRVIAVRQLSIAIGALMGWRWLGEPLSWMRATGVVLIASGCILMGLAR